MIFPLYGDVGIVGYQSLENQVSLIKNTNVTLSTQMT